MQKDHFLFQIESLHFQQFERHNLQQSNLSYQFKYITELRLTQAEKN